MEELLKSLDPALELLDKRIEEGSIYTAPLKNWTGKK